MGARVVLVHSDAAFLESLADAMRSKGHTVFTFLDLLLAVSAPRVSDQIEIAAYYVVAEALTNAAKHALATAIWIGADRADGRLRLTVRDDGVGGADPARGTGLTGLTDRVEALGGWFALESPPGRGTTVSVELPIAIPAAP